MLRRTDILINQIRKQSENTEFSDTTGIGDDEIIQYINDAQHRLQTVILSQHPAVFLTESVMSSVARQEVYDLPSNSYLANKVTNVEYSSTGNALDYLPLQLGNLKNRASGVYGCPVYYIRQSGQLILAPIPDTSSGSLRITYVKKIDQVDIRRGVVSSVTLTGSNVTLLIGDLSATIPLDITALSATDYICIVDRYGNVKMRNLPVLSLDSSTGELEIDSDFAFSTGETLAIGDYIVAGQDTTSHGEFERNCERYVLSYASWRLMKRDSSVDSVEANSELNEMEREIAAAYAEVNDDVVSVPIIMEW